jgi:hypothetical protein
LANSSTAIYDDCNILWSGFGNVSIEFCYRKANQVAHELARDAYPPSNSYNWVDEPPRFIIGLIRYMPQQLLRIREMLVLQFSSFEKCHYNSQDSSKNVTLSLPKMPYF